MAGLQKETKKNLVLGLGITSTGYTTISYVYCECGCGQKTTVSNRTSAPQGLKKGKHKRFISGHNTRLLTPEEQGRRGKLSGAGERTRYTGDRNNYVKLGGKHMHRTVMEKYLGRKLRRDEIVHHIDGDKWNNALSNLQIMTQAEHFVEHLKEIQDKMQKDRGSRCATSKFTVAQVKSIRKLYKEGKFTQKQIGKMFGTDQGNIGYIVRGKTWKHVK